MNKSEKIDSAFENKQTATDFFVKGEISKACDSYLNSVKYLRYIDNHETTNMEKAEVLELMISCHNNIATCQIKLKNFSKAIEAAETAQQMCDALESNKSGKVMQCLRERSITDEKIFFHWCRKSHFLQGKAHFSLKDYKKATDSFKEALKRAEHNEKEKNEIKLFLSKANALLTQENNRAKKMWKGAFRKNSSEAMVSSQNESTNDIRIDSTKNANEKALPRELEKILQRNKSIAAQESDGEDSSRSITDSSSLYKFLGFGLVLAAIGGTFAYVRKKNR